MIAKIASLLLPYLAAVPYSDLVGGVVKTITDTNINGPDGKPVKYPAWFDGTKYVPMVPDGSLVSLLYLEDYGTRIVGREAGGVKMKSTFRIVGWLNGQLPEHVRDMAAAYTLKEIPERMPNSKPLQDLRFEPTRLLTVEEPLFSRYNYQEAVLQYLLEPAQAFAIEVEAFYSFAYACLLPFTEEEKNTFKALFSSKF